MSEREALLEFICERSTGARVRLPCHWIGGTQDVKGFPYDAATDFCRECAESAIADFYEAHPDQRGDEDDEPALFLDGGWGTEHDSPPYCEVCGDPLISLLTEYGVDQELEHFEDHPPDLDYPDEWASFAEALVNLDEDDERWSWVAEHVAAAQAELVARAAKEAELTAAPGMAEARASLVTLLAVRADSQAHKPSFRFWDWLMEFHATSSAEHDTPRWEARIRRMLAEAERFLANFGYEHGGWDCFKAPYGTWRWHFIVEIEQYNLARTRAARTYAAERRARLSLLNLRARYEAGDRISAAAIGFASMTLWAAEQVHKEARERYQETLKAREAQPAPLRWQIKDLELWLKLNPGKGVPAT